MKKQLKKNNIYQVVNILYILYQLEGICLNAIEQNYYFSKFFNKLNTAIQISMDKQFLSFLFLIKYWNKKGIASDFLKLIKSFLLPKDYVGSVSINQITSKFIPRIQILNKNDNIEILNKMDRFILGSSVTIEVLELYKKIVDISQLNVEESNFNFKVIQSLENLLKSLPTNTMYGQVNREIQQWFQYLAENRTVPSLPQSIDSQTSLAQSIYTQPALAQSIYNDLNMILDKPAILIKIKNIFLNENKTVFVPLLDNELGNEQIKIIILGKNSFDHLLQTNDISFEHIQIRMNNEGQFLIKNISPHQTYKVMVSEKDYKLHLNQQIKFQNISEQNLVRNFQNKQQNIIEDIYQLSITQINQDLNDEIKILSCLANILLEYQQDNIICSATNLLEFIQYYNSVITFISYQQIIKQDPNLYKKLNLIKELFHTKQQQIQKYKIQNLLGRLNELIVIAKWNQFQYDYERKYILYNKVTDNQKKIQQTIYNHNY